MFVPLSFPDSGGVFFGVAFFVLSLPPSNFFFFCFVFCSLLFLSFIRWRTPGPGYGQILSLDSCSTIGLHFTNNSLCTISGIPGSTIVASPYCSRNVMLRFTYFDFL